MKILFTNVEFFAFKNPSKPPKLDKLGDEIFGPLIGHPISAVRILWIHFFRNWIWSRHFFQFNQTLLKKCYLEIGWNCAKSDGNIYNEPSSCPMVTSDCPPLYHFRVKMTFWSLKFQFGTNIFIFVHPCISIHSVNIVK